MCSLFFLVFVGNSKRQVTHYQLSKGQYQLDTRLKVNNPKGSDIAKIPINTQRKLNLFGGFRTILSHTVTPEVVTFIAYRGLHVHGAGPRTYYVYVCTCTYTAFRVRS